MKINISETSESELAAAAKKLLEAAHEYWKEYQKTLGDGKSAVVWVESESGHLVVFTRGEYKDVLLDNVDAGITEPKHMFDAHGEN